MVALGNFLREVEVAFQDDSKKYDQFCKLWLDMKLRRIHTRVFIAKLESLFEGHKYLFLKFIRFLPKELKIEYKDASEFFEAVKVALKDDYHDFMKVFEDHLKRKIDERLLLSRLEVLLRGHAYLISQLNTLIPPRFRFTLPRWDELPWDVLAVISQKLDFDDLFQFSRVCTNWRVFHKSIDKSTSQEPLLLKIFNYPDNVSYSFTSLPNQKVYPLNKMMMSMLSFSHDSFPIYVTYSSGYFVIIEGNSSFLLINPFTRIKKKVICPSTFQFTFNSHHNYHALLAFDKCSEDFVLVFLIKESNRLHVYQSRTNAWVTCSTDDPENMVVDFVAFNNIIYVVTDEARIGVLSLNSTNIEFLEMVNYPQLELELELEYESSSFNLVKCDQELLLVRVNTDVTPLDRKAYKIDLSTMTYVELKTLGDIALFYVCFNSCQALTNPNRWGYESNSVYEVCSRACCKSLNCTVYNWDTKSNKYIVPPNPNTNDGKYMVLRNPYTLDRTVFYWCFRHLKYEVDYSL